MSLFGPPNVEILKAKRDVQGLTKALVYRQREEVRQKAAHALGQIHALAAVDALISALRDDSLIVRSAAVSALGEISVVALENSNFEITIKVVEALGRIGGTEAIHYLIASLKPHNPEFRKTVTEALKRIGTPASDELLDTLDNANTNSEIRQHIVEALAEFQDLKSKSMLIKLLLDKDPAVRRIAVRVLSQLNWKPQSKFEYTIWALAANENIFIGEANDRLEQAWKQIDSTDRKIIDLLLSIMDSDVYRGQRIRQFADVFLHKIGSIGDPTALETWVNSLDNQNEDIRAVAVYALAKCKLSKITDQLLPMLKDKSQKVRIATLTALSGLPNAEDLAQITDELISLLKDDSTDVRKATIKALGNLRNEKALHYLLIELDRKGDAFIKRDVLLALGNLKDKRACSRLILIINDKEKGDEIRVEAVSALGAIGCAEAVDSLLAMLMDKYRFSESMYVLASSAAEALGQIGDTRVVEPLIHIALGDSYDSYYQDMVRISAVQALGQLLDVRAITPLVGMLISKTENKKPTVTDRHAAFVLESMLKKVPNHFMLENLQSLASLENFQTKERGGEVEMGYKMEAINVDCSRIRELAHQELARRR